MKTRIARIAMTLALTTTAGTASAGLFGRRGDCAPSAYGPCARQDYTQALEQARRLSDLDCAQLSAYSESVRARMNGQAWASLRQPLVGPAMASALAPLPSIEVPFTPPLKPPAEPPAPVSTPEKPK